MQEASLWACLAGWAVNAGELNTAEVAFAGCEEVDKLQYMLYIKQLPTRESRLAELALYKHNVAEAEAILLQVRHILLPNVCCEMTTCKLLHDRQRLFMLYKMLCCLSSACAHALQDVVLSCIRTPFTRYVAQQHVVSHLMAGVHSCIARQAVLA